jgi:hypothetical protein
MAVAATSTPAAAWGYYHGGWGYHHGGWGWGLGGVAAGLALGATAAAATPYYYGYGYPACGIVRQPVVDEYGIIVGYHHVRVCN